MEQHTYSWFVAPLSHHTLLTGFFLLFQLISNSLVFLAVNIVGLLVHNLMEHAQRKAFLDTRNCIAARLEMEDENEKLVRRSLFVSKSHFKFTLEHSNNRVRS